MFNKIALAFAAGVLVATSFTTAFAQMRPGEGIVATSSLPKPINTPEIVRLDVPHIRQKPNLCVPTSAAMVLRYFGEKHDPVKLKALAENHKPASKRNATFTYWVDMRHSLKQIGKNWYIKDYPKSAAGFERGWKDIRRALRAGNPVLVDVHLLQGHTFVVMGYDDTKQLVYVRDPDIASSRSRAISYASFKKNWHNHRFSNSRSAFFARR